MIETFSPITTVAEMKGSRGTGTWPGPHRGQKDGCRDAGMRGRSPPPGWPPLLSTSRPGATKGNLCSGPEGTWGPTLVPVGLPLWPTDSPILASLPTPPPILAQPPSLPPWGCVCPRGQLGQPGPESHLAASTESRGADSPPRCLVTSESGNLSTVSLPPGGDRQNSDLPGPVLRPLARPSASRPSPL